MILGNSFSFWASFISKVRELAATLMIPVPEQVFNEIKSPLSIIMWYILIKFSFLFRHLQRIGFSIFKIPEEKPVILGLNNLRSEHAFEWFWKFIVLNIKQSPLYFKWDDPFWVVNFQENRWNSNTYVIFNLLI